MLDHNQQAKNLLVSCSPKALGFFWAATPGLGGLAVCDGSARCWSQSRPESRHEGANGRAALLDGHLERAGHVHPSSELGFGAAGCAGSE